METTRVCQLGGGDEPWLGPNLGGSGAVQIATPGRNLASHALENRRHIRVGERPTPRKQIHRKDERRVPPRSIRYCEQVEKFGRSDDHLPHPLDPRDLTHSHGLDWQRCGRHVDQELDLADVTRSYPLRIRRAGRTWARVPRLSRNPTRIAPWAGGVCSEKNSDAPGTRDERVGG